VDNDMKKLLSIIKNLFKIEKDAPDIYVDIYYNEQHKKAMQAQIKHSESPHNLKDLKKTARGIQTEEQYEKLRKHL
jgi:hypothetical protein